MPLPEGGRIPWVPEAWKSTYSKYTEHDAWYSGDPNRLSDVYSSNVFTPTPRGRHWAKEVREERRVMLHVPIAGDIAQTSADLLFSEAPRIRVPDAKENNPTQDRLETIMEDGGIFNRLIEAAETAAALGGTFLKVNWDAEVAPYPVLGVAQADMAIPEFKWGILTAVTYWKVLTDEEHVVWRHLERHEMNNGKAYILNGLYKGTRGELGPRVGLGAHPATAHLQNVVELATLPRLITGYIPNMRPNRMHRGSALGQSDYAGVEGLMDALDETYTSWMRDIRLGQGRIIVPESWLDRQMDGSRSFDVDQEVFTTLDMDPLNAEKAGITLNQFEIRTEQHHQTATELIHRIVATAGYSAQTFGLNVEGRAESGYALNIRERRSFLTKSKKERYFGPVVADMIELMLMVDKEVFKSGVTPVRPNIEFADSIAQDINQVSEAVELINRAQAASVKTRVKMLHPDWTEEQVEAEAKEIIKEAGMLTGDEGDTNNLPV